MGAVYCGAGEYRSAERCYRRALQLMAADDNSDARSAALQGLEAVYTQTREFTKAEHYGRLALEIREKELGPDNADLGAPLQNLAAVYHSERRYAEAESLYTRALRVLEKGGRAGDRAAANVHNNLARLFGDTGNLDRGIQQAKLAVAIWEGVAGPQDPQLAMGLTNLAKLYCRARRWPDAEEAIERARRIVASAGAGRGPRLEPILRTYADVMAHTGRKREAKQLLHEADALRAEFDRENLIGYTVDVKARGAN
jgi:tetratricopeptide (TPR) repeat protein